jgi:hypothetical protein
MKQARTFREMLHLIRLAVKAVFLVLMLGVRRLFNWRLKNSPAFKKEWLSLSYGNKSVPGILYTTQRDRARPVFLLIAGIGTYINKRRLFHRLAQSFALVGYHAVIYEDPGLDNGSLSLKTVEDIKHVIRAISNNQIADAKRIVLIGSDFSARFIMSAITDKNINCLVRSILLFSPVSDMKTSSKFAFTGKIRAFGKLSYLEPASSPRFVFLNNISKEYFKWDLSPGLQSVIEDLLKNRTDIALRNIHRLDVDLKNNLSSIFRGDIEPKEIDRLLKISYKRLGNRVFDPLPEHDLGKPVFLIHNILDRYVDYGQSTMLFDRLHSSTGVYLHLTNFLNGDEATSVFSNPARWFKGAAVLSSAFYRLLVVVYTSKNLPYNPTGEPLRYRI